MSRLLRIVSGVATVACALTLYGSLEQSGRRVAAEPPALLGAISDSLAGAGMHQRDDVSIEMNGRDVALGFSRPGCDGLMLVSVLPHTAQGWAHMAPRLDLSRYHLGYLYNGARYPLVPKLERLADRLRGDLRPHRISMFPQVIALAEAGNCGLARSAAAVLEAVSRGRLPAAGRPESGRGKGDVYA